MKIISFRGTSIILIFLLAALIVFSYFGLILTFGYETVQPDSLLSALISAGVGVYISIIVYIYSKKQYNDRQKYLRNKIISNIEQLNSAFLADERRKNLTSDLTPSGKLFINESLLNQKNLLALHTFDFNSELETNSELSKFVNTILLQSMGIPEIRRNLDGSFEEPDYIRYEIFKKGQKIVLEFLKNSRSDYDKIPKILVDLAAEQDKLYETRIEKKSKDDTSSNIPRDK